MFTWSPAIWTIKYEPHIKLMHELRVNSNLAPAVNYGKERNMLYE